MGAIVGAQTPLAARTRPPYRGGLVTRPPHRGGLVPSVVCDSCVEFYIQSGGGLTPSLYSCASYNGTVMVTVYSTNLRCRARSPSRRTRRMHRAPLLLLPLRRTRPDERAQDRGCRARACRTGAAGESVSRSVLRPRPRLPPAPGLAPRVPMPGRKD